MTAALAALCLALLLAAWRGAADDLFIAWQSEEYSHGALIPVVALLMAWHILATRRPKLRPSWRGTAWLAAAGLLMLAAEMAAFQTAAHYGLILGLAALSLTFLGTAATAALAPAFVYLFFAVPLPHILFAGLSQDLQLASSTLGVWLLGLAAVPVFQEGNIIDLGSYKLQVVEACSGLRYLFPLLSFGYLAAWLLEDRAWKRAVLFVSAVPITIGMNALRIALIGVTVAQGGEAMAEGLIHDFEGWAVFALCAALLMLEARLLLSVGGGGRFRFEMFAVPALRIPAPPRPGAPAIASAAALMALLAATEAAAGRAPVIPPPPDFAGLPPALGQWRGRPQTLEPEVLRELRLSDYRLADYRKPGEKTPVNFYLAYYARQRIGSAAHSPSSCIPGGGWRIVSRSTERIALDGGASVAVSRFLIRRGEATQLAYFWFEERGRNLTETTQAKWYLLVDAVTTRRSDGALVRLITPVAHDEGEAQAEARLKDFLSAAYPAVKSVIPGKEL